MDPTQLLATFAAWACEQLGLARLAVGLNPQCPNAWADPQRRCVEWNPAFLAQRSPFEVQAITAHEVGHFYNWDVLHVANDRALHERFADSNAGWLVGRAGILPNRGDLGGLAAAVDLLPSAHYRAAHNRLRDLLHGWGSSGEPRPPSYLVGAA